MNKWLELLFGLILVIVPILIAGYSHMAGWNWDFWTAAGIFFRGGLFWFVLMIGVLFILLGISDLKEPARPMQTHRPMQHPPQQPMAMSMSMPHSTPESTSQARKTRKK